MIATKSAKNIGVLDRAKAENCLDQRINSYKNRQSLDLNEWVFREVKAPVKGTVLELCSGTGAQTSYLARQVGPAGRVIAVDASEEALTKTLARCSGIGGEIIPLCGELDNLADLLKQAGIRTNGIDLCFCSYGLYYAQNVEKLIDVIREYLAPGGELVVVGPYGRNNHELFELLTASGVKVPEYVIYTSRDFMTLTLLPLIADKFSRTIARMAVNTVSWTNPQEVLSYWRNTTFFEADREAVVSSHLDDHFRTNDDFINRKHIMSVSTFLS